MNESRETISIFKRDIDVLAEEIIKAIFSRGQFNQLYKVERVVISSLKNMHKAYHLGINDVVRFVTMMVVILSHKSLAEYFYNYFSALELDDYFDIDIEALIFFDDHQYKIKANNFDIEELENTIREILAKSKKPLLNNEGLCV